MAWWPIMNIWGWITAPWNLIRKAASIGCLSPHPGAEEIQKSTEQYFAKLRAEKAVPEEHEASAQTKVSGSPYQKKKDQLEDVRSTASAFLAVGIIGMVLIVLILAGVIPFPFAASSKVLMLSVMSLLFLVFIGIRYPQCPKGQGTSAGGKGGRRPHFSDPLLVHRYLYQSGYRGRFAAAGLQ